MCLWVPRQFPAMVLLIIAKSAERETSLRDGERKDTNEHEDVADKEEDDPGEAMHVRPAWALGGTVEHEAGHERSARHCTSLDPQEGQEEEAVALAYGVANLGNKQPLVSALLWQHKK